MRFRVGTLLETDGREFSALGQGGIGNGCSTQQLLFTKFSFFTVEAVNLNASSIGERIHRIVQDNE